MTSVGWIGNQAKPDVFDRVVRFYNPSRRLSTLGYLGVRQTVLRPQRHWRPSLVLPKVFAIKWMLGPRLRMFWTVWE